LILALCINSLYIAHWAEKRSNLNGQLIRISIRFPLYIAPRGPIMEALVLRRIGLKLPPIYVGPVIIIPTWMIILKRIVRISRVNKISSIADFISLRYGNSRFLEQL
jgi:hypothetical protein